MNPALDEDKEISQKERELRNLQNNFFQEEKDQEEILYYNPNLEELKKNTSLKPKIIKGFIFCKQILIYLE